MNISSSIQKLGGEIWNELKSLDLGHILPISINTSAHESKSLEGLCYQPSCLAAPALDFS